MENNRLKLVIVGHVDHGKSTLIGRLLYETNSFNPDKMDEIEKASKELGDNMEFAYFLDCLEEERLQGITIETTQIFFKTAKRSYTIIDAPGHTEFIRNMITGASQAEAAVLIVDAKDGIKEQTKRHAYVLSLLGIEQLVVVLNKMDLVAFNKDKYNSLKKEVSEFLSNLNMFPSFYIPIVASLGDNIIKKSEKMNWDAGPTFLEALDLLKNKGKGENSWIFPVQDVYKLRDRRIVVGRIESGMIKVGQEIMVLPGEMVTKVTSIDKYPSNVNSVIKGESIGVTTKDPLFIERGNILCEPNNKYMITQNIPAVIFWMAKNNFNRNETNVIRCVTQESDCKIDQISKRINSASLEIIEKNSDIIGKFEVAEVMIKTKKPIVITKFNQFHELGRFVLEKDGIVCAGGVVSEIVKGK